MTPPTQLALQEAIKRAHFQAMVWKHDEIANPELQSPQSYGWQLHENELYPVMTSMAPAPDVIHLIKCGCTLTRCSTNHCQCKKAGLSRTHMCKCSDLDDRCKNVIDSDKEMND